VRTCRSPTVMRSGWVFSVHLRLFGMVAAARQFGPWAPQPRCRTPTVAWFLDCDDPSVRYFTLTLLGESADGLAAAKTRCRMMTGGAVPLILAAQREEGHRCERKRFYTANMQAASIDEGGLPYRKEAVVPVGDDSFKYCNPDKFSCVTFGGFKVNQEGKLVDLTVNNEPVGPRLTMGNGQPVTAAGTTFTLLTAYQSDLHISAASRADRDVT
jgi:hypothetical protein